MNSTHTAILVALFLAGAGHVLARDNPHAEMEDQAKCGTCHQGSPTESKEMKKSVNEICLECHDPAENTHPLEIPHDLTCPPDLPLSAEGKVNCLTCHYAHGDWESDRPCVSTSAVGGIGRMFGGKKKYKTYFLRRNNFRGELCLACHKNY